MIFLDVSETGLNLEVVFLRSNSSFAILLCEIAGSGVRVCFNILGWFECMWRIKSMDSGEASRGKCRFLIAMTVNEWKILCLYLS